MLWLACNPKRGSVCLRESCAAAMAPSTMIAAAALLAKVSLTLASVVFILGCQDLGSGPVGPDGLVPQFAKPGRCEDDPGHQSCKGDDAGDDGAVPVIVGCLGCTDRSSPDLCVKAEEAPRLRLGCLGDLLFLEE